jgi:hypothetical protein
MVKFSCFKRVNFSYAGSFQNVFFVSCITVLCSNSKEMIRKSFSLAYLCRMLLFYACSSYKSWLNMQRRIIFEWLSFFFFVEVCYYFGVK